MSNVIDRIHEAVAVAAADWFTVAPKYRTKERLLQMLEVAVCQTK